MFKRPWKAIFFLGAGVHLFGLGAGVWTTPAHAFPEMVRHGYTNCTSCHLSPTGGGLLTSYGRGLSREVLSAWGSSEEGSTESNFAYLKEKPPEWLNLGGELRTVELYQDKAAFRSAKLMLMQVDLEGAVSWKSWSFVASFGLQGEAGKYSPSSSAFLSRTHYALFHLTDEVSFRAGRFFPAYGLNTADHVIATKQGLRMGLPGWESYNLEAAYLGEQWNAIVTGIFGRPDASELKRETGVAAQAAYSFAERYKVGWSFLHTSSNGIGRDVTGPYAILGFTPQFFLLSEMDLQRQDSESEAVTYNRLDYEFVQGIHGYLTHEMTGLDPSFWGTQSQIYGAGFQFFPRTHFEVNLSWQVKANPAQAGKDHYAWLLFHFYL